MVNRLTRLLYFITIMLDVLSAGHYYCMPAYKEELSNYNSFLLLYLAEGNGTLEYRNQTFPLDAGQVIIVQCTDRYCYAAGDTCISETFWIHFNGSESKSYFESIYKNAGPVVHLDGDQSILLWFKQIIAMLEEKDLKIDIAGSSILVNILTGLLLKSMRITDEKNDMPKAVQKAVAILESSFKQPMSLDTLAKETFMSKFHLSKLFKKHVGVSPYEYLIRFRLNYAKRLLKNTGLTVQAAAHEVGFESPSHFVKMFHKYEGVTPLQFRLNWNDSGK